MFDDKSYSLKMDKPIEVFAKESLNESRKRWLMTGYSSSKGEVILDDGAINAIKNSNES